MRKDSRARGFGTSWRGVQSVFFLFTSPSINKSSNVLSLTFLFILFICNSCMSSLPFLSSFQLWTVLIFSPITSPSSLSYLSYHLFLTLFPFFPVTHLIFYRHIYSATCFLPTSLHFLILLLVRGEPHDPLLCCIYLPVHIGFCLGAMPP